MNTALNWYSLYTRDGKSWKNKEWVRNCFDFKLWTVWFYGGLNNRENTNNNQWQKSHSTVCASRPSTYLFFLYLRNSSEFCRLSYDDEILTFFVSDLKICFLANLLFSFHTYRSGKFNFVSHNLRIRRVTWLRAATAMFMHAHFNRWHYYILEFFFTIIVLFQLLQPIFPLSHTYEE